MAQAGKAAPDGAAFPAGDSSGLLPITRSMTAQALPVHCGHAPSKHALENRNRRSGWPSACARLTNSAPTRVGGWM